MSIDATVAVELLKLGASVFATVSERSRDRSRAELVASAAEAARRLLNARAGGSLDNLTNEQLLVVLRELQFEDPEVIAERAREVQEPHDV